MEWILDKAINFVEKYQTLSDKEKNICRYGLELFFFSNIVLASILVLSCMIGVFLETVTFFSSFILLRVFTGGYHAKSRLSCYALTLSIFFIFAMVVSLIPEESIYIFSFCGCFISLGIIVLRYPQVPKNKIIINGSVLQYYYTSLIIGCLEASLVSIGQILFPNSIVIFSFMLGLFTASISVYVDDRRGKRIV